MKVIPITGAWERRRWDKLNSRQRRAVMIVDGRRFHPALFDDERDIDRVLEHHPAFRYTVGHDNLD
jgi:hypothetical protein